MEALSPIPVLLMVRELGLGGTERQLTEMARALDRSRFEPHVACFRANGFRAEELRACGIPIVRLPAGSLYRPSTLKGAFRLRRYLSENRIRVVHTYDTPMNLFGVPAARAFGVPVVISSQRAYRCLTPPAGRHLLRLTDRMVDAVVVNCRALQRHLVDDERVPASSIQVCYNGIDTAVFHPGAPSPVRPPDASLVIGVVCALRPEKNLETLLRAFARLRRLHAGIRLLIVGSGPSLPALERLSAELGIGEDCRFEPAAADVTPWMRAIDIFVLPSMSEALSNSLMEAMACGCCPVASDIGGNPELVVPSETGLLFRAGDPPGLAAQLEILIANDCLRKRFAAASVRLLHQRFSLAASARRMAAIYESLLRM